MSTTSTSTTTTTSSSSLILKTDYYLQSYYKDNRSVRKGTSRKEYTSTELAYEDSKALRRAIKKLESFDFSDDDNEEAVKSAVSAFVTVYNNTLSDTDTKSMSKDMQRYAKKLKQAVEEYSDEFSKAGFTIADDGTMSYSEDRLKSDDMSKLKSIFSKLETKYLRSTYSTSEKIKRSAYDELYSQLTGNGTQLNITL